MVNKASSSVSSERGGGEKEGHEHKTKPAYGNLYSIPCRKVTWVI